jgi:fluoride ion exporter CrcB/FEX
MKKNISVIREILLFTLGVLLLIYASLNISISPPPETLAEIPQQYGKTFCIPITSISSSSQEGIQLMKQKMNQAYALVLLALVGGLFLILVSFVSVWHTLVQWEQKLPLKQMQRQLRV